MRRLIDADDVMRMLTDVELNNGTITDAKIELRNVKIAYSIEKVVAELEEEMNDAKNLWDDDEYYTGCANAFESAIEIVLKGEKE